jgi:hypothetical protein
MEDSKTFKKLLKTTPRAYFLFSLKFNTIHTLIHYIKRFMLAKSNKTNQKISKEEENNKIIYFV